MEFPTIIKKAADHISREWGSSPAFGIVLGTGAGQVADEIAVDQILPYEQIPFFPKSTATGHRGQLVCGRLAGANIIAMQGRFHLYEGYPVDLSTLPIHVMNQLGIKTLFISNASGGINPNYQSGEIMLIESHLDFMFRSTADLSPLTRQQRPTQLSDLYDRKLIQQAITCARQQDFVLHQGVYASMLGPNYETKAEYRFLKKAGADVVGMSTVPEVNVASRYGMQVLAMSVVSNVAKPDVLEATSGQEVIDAAAIAAPNLRALVVNAIGGNDKTPPAQLPCPTS